MSATIQNISNRIQALEPRLRRIANQFASDPMDADDIFSEIVEAILTKCDPGFSDAKILTKAKWVACDHTKSIRTYNKYIDDESAFIAAPEGDLENCEADFEQISANIYPNPEDAIIACEEADELALAISEFSPTLHLTFSLLRKGYKLVEIAQKMGISKSAVSQNVFKISRKLAAKRHPAAA